MDAATPARPVVRKRTQSQKGARATRSGRPLVLTPGGYRHASLVHVVEPGHGVHVAEGRTRLINLRTEALVDVPEPGLLPRPMSGPLPGPVANWITYGNWVNATGTPVSSFRTTWQVPPAPKTLVGQTIFLFNGMENSGTVYGILQPVLQLDGYTGQWSVASWYVTSTGTVFTTAPVPVSSGDALVGAITLTGQAGGLFNYTCEFVGIPGTSLPILNLTELYWCVETLEAYGITQCSDYPEAAFTAMKEIEIQTGSSSPTLSWTPVDVATGCGEHTVVVSSSSTDGEVDLYYRKLKPKFLVSLLPMINPVLLWLIRHGWEDPTWGTSPQTRRAIASAIHDLAGQIADPEIRAELQALARKAMATRE